MGAEVGDDVFVMDAVIEIPDLSSIRARIQVDEVDSGKIRVGQEATISVDAVRSRTYSGKVVNVGTILKQASFDRPQKVCDAYIKIEAEDMSNLEPLEEIESVHDALVRRLLRLAERDLGPPPCPYAWLVFGSEGRMEADDWIGQARELHFKKYGDSEVA